MQRSAQPPHPLLHRYEPLWQDRDIRFDAASSELSLRPGERVIEAYSRVEDTKGNTGEVGKFTVTNLRLIWQSLSKPRINLSIGFNNITTITNRLIHTKLRGRNEALYMMTKVNGTRYEFIFIRLEPVLGVSREMVDLVGAVCKAYVSTRLYRDLRLRSAILAVSSKQLKMLQSEQIYSSVGGVWNLSSDQGNLGTMYLTNVRVVWHANMNELFNISLPFIQIRNIKVRESKFGLALVIESSESSGGYVLGFRVDPVEKLNSVFEELNNLYTVHSATPDFGVHAYLSYNAEARGGGGGDFNGEGVDGHGGMPNLMGSGGAEGGAGGGDGNMSAMMAMMTAGAGGGGGLHGFSAGSLEGNFTSSDAAGAAAAAAAAGVSTYEEMAGEGGNGYLDEGVSGGGGGHHSYGDAVAAYLAEGESSETAGKRHEWVYVPALGLSIEKIKDGYTMESLWEVVES